MSLRSGASPDENNRGSPSGFYFAAGWDENFPVLINLYAEEIPGIVRYQIIQEEAKIITVRIGKEFTENTEYVIKDRYKKLLGREFTVRVETVRQLSKDDTGKFHVVKSRSGVKNG